MWDVLWQLNHSSCEAPLQKQVFVENKNIVGLGVFRNWILDRVGVFNGKLFFFFFLPRRKTQFSIKKHQEGSFWTSPGQQFLRSSINGGMRNECSLFCPFLALTWVKHWLPCCCGGALSSLTVGGNVNLAALPQKSAWCRWILQSFHALVDLVLFAYQLLSS